VAAAVSLGACVLITQAQVLVWQNTETLFRHALSVTTNNWVALNCLGFYCEDHREARQGESYFRAALEINPGCQFSWQGLSRVLLAQRRYEETAEACQTVLRLNPQVAEAHAILGQALIKQGNTLASPLFTDASGQLKTFDYVVANPPFSDKRWSTGLDPANDPFERFKHYGVPPAKQGDYAYLLHILRSLKSGGKGACILPHGVLFRGNAEATIRKNLVQRGYLKAIIGLPANLFYGAGIPACIIVLDKEAAAACKGIFMIDASKGFIKDGNKNHLRAQDIHKIVDTFTR